MERRKNPFEILLGWQDLEPATPRPEGVQTEPKIEDDMFTLCSQLCLERQKSLVPGPIEAAAEAAPALGKDTRLCRVCTPLSSRLAYQINASKHDDFEGQ